MDSNIGKKLDGRYELLELIGVGGMADIYRARDIEEDRIVAVKILKTEFAGSDEFLRRFRNESKAIALLSHPNIVKIYDVGFTEKVQFIVMEYVDGITLTDYIEQQGVLKWRDSIHFTVQILKALQHAHDRGIVHRDVKSQNVMLLRDGTIKVMDFGIARFNRENNKTMSEKTIGSVHYISPEQARGDITDERSDIYSVGVALYEMVTGKKPFDGDTPVSIALMHMQSTPKKPTELNSTIPEGLEQIILRAMQKEPAQRYQTAGEMIKDLEELKKNPGIIFEYKYNSTDGTTKYFDRPIPAGGQDNAHRRKEMVVEIPDDDDYDDEDYDDDDDDEYEERRSPLVPILFAVGTAFIIATVFLVLMLVNKYFGSGSSQASSSHDNSDTSISITASDELLMPNLIGLTWDEAVDKYSQYINLVAQTEYSTYEKDEIFDQEFPEGRKIKVGATVEVKVSKGIKEVEIQDVTNLAIDAAERKLVKDGFVVKKSFAESEDIPKNNVIKTEPPAHEMAQQGSTVIVYVSLGAGDTLMTVPKLTDMPMSEALERCNEYSLVPKITMVDSEEEENRVLKQSIAPGEFVSKNTEIELEVSTGVIPEKTINIRIPIPASAKGEFEFKYYIDGELDVENSGDVYDVELIAENGIAYALKGREGDVKEFTVKVTSQKTGASGVYMKIKFTFATGDGENSYEFIERESGVFKELLAAEPDDDTSGDTSSDTSDDTGSDTSGGESDTSDTSDNESSQPDESEPSDTSEPSDESGLPVD